MTAIARLLSLRVDLRDPDAAAEVTPDALAAYAERTGWALATTTSAHRVYRRGPDELHVPIDAGWPDYGRAILSELAELSRAEGRSSLAIWAELVGWRDVAAEQAAVLDRAVATMVAAPRMFGTTSEAVLFQALLALETAAALRGDPEVRARYDALRARHRIPSSLHASSRIGLDGIGAFIAELAGLPIPETPPACHDVACGEAPGAPMAPEAAPTAQGTLPGVEAPRRVRSCPVHRWGIIAAEHMPPTPLDPDRSALVQRCPHCSALRRRANTGSRLGAQDMYSTDGGASWQYQRPPCVMK